MTLSSNPSPLRIDWRLSVIVAIAAATVGLTILRFPPSADPPFDLSLIGWPHWDKLLSVLRSLATLALFNLSALSLGRPLEKRLRTTQSRAFALVLRLGLGFIVQANLVLLLAATHLLYPPVLLATVLLPALLGIRHTYREIRELASACRLPIGPALTALLFVSPLLAAFVPDYGWDAFVYHLAIPERYLFTNGIWVTPFQPATAFPLLTQMLYTLSLALDPGPLTKLLHLEFGLLTVVTAALLARRISPRAAAFTIAILAADQLLFWEMGIAYVDLATCFFALIAASAAIEYSLTNNRRDLIQAALFAGAAIACHWRLATVTIAVFVVLLWPPWNRRRLADLAIFGFFSTLVLLPWVARNIAFVGNPLSPIAQGVFHSSGEEYFDPVAIAQQTAMLHARGPERSLGSLLLMPWELAFGRSPQGLPLYTFQIGCLYMLALVACLLAARRAGPRQSRYLAIVGVGTLLWFASGAIESRYLLPFLIILALAGGAALNQLVPTRRVLSRVLALILLSAIAYAQLASLRLLPWRWGYALGNLSITNFESQEPALVIANHLRETLGPSDRILLVFESRSYFFRGLDYIPYYIVEGAPTLQMIHSALNADDLHRNLLAMGVTHVLINSKAPLTYRTRSVYGYDTQDFEADLAMLRQLVEDHTRPLLEDRGVVVVRLNRAG